MPTILRIELLIVAILFLVIVFWAINRKKLQLRYSLVWMLIAFCMIIAAFFPDSVVFLSNLVGIETASNFIYFVALIILLILSFSLTCIVSKQSDQIKRLAQHLSVNSYQQEEMMKIQMNKELEKEKKSEHLL